MFDIRWVYCDLTYGPQPGAICVGERLYQKLQLKIESSDDWVDVPMCGMEPKKSIAQGKD